MLSNFSGGHTLLITMLRKWTRCRYETAASMDGNQIDSRGGSNRSICRRNLGVYVKGSVRCCLTSSLSIPCLLPSGPNSHVNRSLF